MTSSDKYLSKATRVAKTTVIVSVAKAEQTAAATALTAATGSDKPAAFRRKSRADEAVLQAQRALDEANALP